MPDTRKVLIITKASLKMNWFREATKWLVNRDLTIGIAGDGVFPSTDVVIINYDICAKFQHALWEREWDVTICDEVHLCKNRKAKRTKAIFGYKPGKNESVELASSGIPSRYKLALSGTPIENNIEEMWTVLWWLNREEFPSRWKLLSLAGCKSAPGMQTGPTDIGLERLQEFLRRTVMIRRLKKDVLTELPPKTRIVTEFDGSGMEHLIDQEREIWDQCEADRIEAQAAVEVARASDDPEAYKSAVAKLRETQSIAFTEMARVRRETAEAKVPKTIAHIRERLDEVGKMIVFAHHTECLESFAQAFGSLGVLVHGGTSLPDRDARVNRFQTDPSCRLFFGSIRATGEGLNLTAANYVLFHEFDWVPSKMVQCEDRCIAEGQNVLTPNGWRPIESIVIGDYVINRFSHAAKVLDKWERGATEMMVEFAVEGWPEPIICTATHRVRSNGTWVEAGTLRPGNAIEMPESIAFDKPLASVPFDHECRNANDFIGHHGGVISNGRLVKAPDVVELTDQALFVLGYYAGDGFSSIDPSKGRFVSFSGNKTTKVEALAQCEAWAESVGMHVGRYESKDGQAVEIRAYSVEWANWFTLHFGKGAVNKRLPQFVLSLTKEQREKVLEGLIASDGYVRDNRREYVTMSKGLAAQVAGLMMASGHKPCVTRKSEASGSAYVVAYTIGVQKGLLVESITFRHPRRTKGKRERVFDLTIEGDPSFIVGTAVVHNCHRIGQQDNVTVEVCIVDGTIDARMAKVCVSKADLAESALDSLAAKQEVEEPAPVVTDWKPLATARELKSTALLVTPQMRAAVHAGLSMLAGVCDGARKIDGAGFNKLDSAIGKKLAMTPVQFLSDRQIVLGAKLVNKYRRQLPEAVVEESTKVFGESKGTE